MDGVSSGIMGNDGRLCNSPSVIFFLDLLSFIHNEQCHKQATDHLKGEKFFTWLPYMVI